MYHPTKLKHNRTICDWVNLQIVPSCFISHPCGYSFSEMQGCTKVSNWARHSTVIGASKFLLDFRHAATFRNCGDSKSMWLHGVENRSKISSVLTALLRSASTKRLDVRSNLPSVNGRTSCLSCCWREGLERPAKRCDISFVAGGVQEHAQDVLVPPLLRNCDSEWHFLFLVITSSPVQWSLQ